MGLAYGQSGYIITADNVSSVNITAGSLASYDNDGTGVWTFSMNNVGCGSTGANILINDATIPFAWTRIAWKTQCNFRSSCWNFAQSNGGYGNGTHNIFGWSPANGDAISKPVNSFELPQYTVKMQACDNNSDNFMHGGFATGSFRHWNMLRRRSVGTGPAGPAAGFACTSGGTCIISQIVVFR